MSIFQRLKTSLTGRSSLNLEKELTFKHDLERERSPLTVAQLHAVLEAAMNEGLGHRPVEIELAFVEGQLSGMPAAVLDNAVIDWNWWSMGKDGKNVRLRPCRSLVAMSEKTFFGSDVVK